MRRLILAMALVMAFIVSGCTDPNQAEQRPTSEQGGNISPTEAKSLTQLPDGFDGGCTSGIELWTQYQFTPYGAKVRDTPESESFTAGLPGNNRLLANGWFRDGNVLTPDNPEGIRGEVWYYVPDPPFKTKGDEGVWVSDAAVRSTFIRTPAKKDRSKFFKPSQAAPRSPSCELKR